MARDRGDILQGTLDMLVLKALQLEPMHGWGLRLTPRGRRHLNQELADWRRMSRATNLVLEATLDSGGA